MLGKSGKESENKNKNSDDFIMDRYFDVRFSLDTKGYFTFKYYKNVLAVFYAQAHTNTLPMYPRATIAFSKVSFLFLFSLSFLLLASV